jgi:hypothetical protein
VFQDVHPDVAIAAMVASKKYKITLSFNRDATGVKANVVAIEVAVPAAAAKYPRTPDPYAGGGYY